MKEKRYDQDVAVGAHVGVGAQKSPFILICIALLTKTALRKYGCRSTLARNQTLTVTHPLLGDIG